MEQNCRQTGIVYLTRRAVQRSSGFERRQDLDLVAATKAGVADRSPRPGETLMPLSLTYAESEEFAAGSPRPDDARPLRATPAFAILAIGLAIGVALAALRQWGEALDPATAAGLAIGGVLWGAVAIRWVSRAMARRDRAPPPAACELRLEAERLTAILDAVDDGIFVADPETAKLIDVNQVGADMFGYSPGELIGADLGVLSPGLAPHTHEQVLGWITNALSEGPQTLEWQAKAKDGRPLRIELSIRYALVADRPAVVATARDVTLHRPAEMGCRQPATTASPAS
ncbi:MAG: PAS domain-containing protein [Caulobacterales bacterium]